jgi:hypothetical protein
VPLSLVSCIRQCNVYHIHTSHYNTLTLSLSFSIQHPLSLMALLQPQPKKSTIFFQPLCIKILHSLYSLIILYTFIQIDFKTELVLKMVYSPLVFLHLFHKNSISDFIAVIPLEFSTRFVCLIT